MILTFYKWIKDKSIINYLKCANVWSVAAGGATFVESAVLEFMKLGAVFAHVGFASLSNSIS